MVSERGASLALQLAIFYDDSEVLRSLMQAGVDINTPLEHDGRTALMMAAAGGKRVVQQLLDSGADVNARSGIGIQQTALIMAGK